MTERRVRFTEECFEHLDALLPAERGVDGSPSTQDFLLIELPRLRDRLAEDFEGNTLGTEDPLERVLIAAGTLFQAIALYALVDVDDVVVVLDVTLH